MNIEEARLYLEHTSKDDFNLEEWQKENRYQAIRVMLEEIERLEKDNERYCIAINEMAIIISNAIEYMERYMFSQKENYDYIHLLDILKGVDKE